MQPGKSTVLVTGVAGNLGLRLLPQLRDYDVAGVDLQEPTGAQISRFLRLDIGEEPSCQALVQILRETQAAAVVHLAFVIDPLRTGVLDVDRMWRINVAGTARVMEAIAEVNRTGGRIAKFIFPSSVSAYGPDLPQPVGEEEPLHGHTLPYAIHKREADAVVRSRAEGLGSCRTYLLRPHIFTGASMQNYMVGALRGEPTGKGRFARWMRAAGIRLPLVLPMGRRYRRNKYQFVHVDDMARLIVHILDRSTSDSQLTVLNVAGRGEPIAFAECVQIAHARLLRLPGRAACGALLKLLWALGISGVPPQALPYLAGSYTMNTNRLRRFLGPEYENVIRYETRGALADSFIKHAPAANNTVSAGAAL